MRVTHTTPTASSKHRASEKVSSGVFSTRQKRIRVVTNYLSLTNRVLEDSSALTVSSTYTYHYYSINFGGFTEIDSLEM